MGLGRVHVASVAVIAGVLAAIAPSLGAADGGCLHTMEPCRLLDTRLPGQGPALQHLTPRAVAAAGACGVPANATAVAVNLTAIGPSGDGELGLAKETGEPASVVVPFPAGRTRANSGLVPLSTGGPPQLLATLPLGGEVHAAIDVTGFLRANAHAPTALDNSFSGDEGITCLQITLIGDDADGDPVVFVITSLPTNGNLFEFSLSQADRLGEKVSSTSAMTTSLLCYKPNTRFFHGTDSFRYKAFDDYACPPGPSFSAEATISIDIRDIN